MSGENSGFANYLMARSSTAGPAAPVSDVGALGVPDTRLRAGARIGAGQSISSPNRQFRLLVQTDGNVVLYHGRSAIWDVWDVYQERKAVRYVVMQKDGNFVAYGPDGRAVWSSATNGNGGAFLALQNDGNLVVYKGNSALWSSHTEGGRDARGDTHGTILGAITGAVGGALKMAAPVLSAAAGVASFVPGIGTVAASALGVAAALGRGASVGDLALEAARSAIPGGAVARVAFDVAVGIATHQPITGIALAQIRNQIPGGDMAKAAFDAGLAVAYHAKPAEVAHAASRLPPKVVQHFAAPVLAAARVRAASPAKRAKMLRELRRATKKRPLSNRAKAYVVHAIKVHAAGRLDVGALSVDAKTYTVERGDSAWRIAQNLTGDGNHHYKELIAANSPPKSVIHNADGSENFRYLKTGEVLQIPSSWIGQFVHATGAIVVPPSGPIPIPTPVNVPTVTPPPAPVPSPAPAATIPPAPSPALPPATHAPGDERDDPAAISQAKSILVAWEHTDGAAAAGLPDYGGNTDDQSPIWGPRDSLELRAFVVWSNAHGTALSLLGDLTQAKLDALVAWAENKASQVATGQGSVSPAGLPLPAPAGGTIPVAPGPSPIPISGPAVPSSQASVISVPETDISEGKKGGGVAWGVGLAAVVLLGLGVALDSKGKKAA